MRKLDDCEFCGAEAVGAFEVVPADLSPADDPRRAVLCADCRARLETLVEPLLDRARTATDRTGASDAGADVPDPGADASDAGTGRGTSEGGGTDGASITFGADDAGTDDTAGADGSADAGDSTGENDGAGADGSAGADEAADTDDSAGAGDAADDDTGAADGGSDRDASGGTTDRPPAYGKVLRLVRNREFPMERAEIESLAAGAYDLTDREARLAIDRAVEEGELVADGDRLRRP